MDGFCELVDWLRENPGHDDGDPIEELKRQQLIRLIRGLDLRYDQEMAQLLAMPRPDDRAPIDLLVREISRLEPQKVYLPLGVGDHVDHQLVRDVGVALLELGRRWVMPGPEYAGIVTYYEDFPYAWWNDFRRIEDLPKGALAGMPADVAITPDYADISDMLDRKIMGIRLYESQLDRLFGGADAMADAVRGYGAKVAGLTGRTGAAERYWKTSHL